MELQHTFTVPAPVDRAWATLLDVEGIAPCFPGAALTSVDGDQFAGTVKVKLGPVSLQYAGKGRFLERDEAARSVRLEANGSDKRGNGTAGATVHARLEPESEGVTRVVVDTDLKVTGRPAQFGRGVLQDVGGKIIQQFAACLAQRMAEPATAPDGADEPAADPSATRQDAAVTALHEVGAGAEVPSVAPGGTVAADDSQPSRPTAAAPSTTTEPAAPNTVAPEAAAPNTAAPNTAPAVPEPAAPAELDLNAVVLPALARRYGPALVAAIVAVLVLRLLRRSRR